MEEIIKWANIVCTVAVICSLCEMIIPQGDLSKAFYFVLGIFLIVSVLIPFSDMIKNFRIESVFREENRVVSAEMTAVDDLHIAYGKSVIEDIVADTLKENHLPYEKIEINMDSSQGKSIDIIRAEIYVGAEEQNRLEEYRTAVKEKTGIIPSITLVR